MVFSKMDDRLSGTISKLIQSYFQGAMSRNTTCREPTGSTRVESYFLLVLQREI